MKKILTLLFTAMIFINACKQRGPIHTVKNLSIEGINALGPYLTQDNKGNEVLCWSEQGQDSLYRLKYAVYDQQLGGFGKTLTVTGSEGISTSAESMGKVAFKTDGTVIALYAKRFPTERNPYAGAIYYSSSTNGGATWSASQFIHSDTSHAYGRSFFDITTLKDGELAAVWLDGRFGKSIKGSALFFSRTTEGKGFGVDTCLEKGTCECCRTDILSDKMGNIHIAYRNITFPSELSEKQVRDMAYKLSTDNGKTFSRVKTISNDNWQIDGCPHSGPSLTVTDNVVNAVWFTAGGGPGIYRASSSDSKSNFDKRSLITSQGRHPQQVSLPSGKVVMVCEETDEGTAGETMKMDHSHGGMSMDHKPASNSKIVMRILTSEVKNESMEVTDGRQPDHHAVIAPIGKGVLIVWVRDHKAQSQICYTQVNKE